jgi:hypothetical protein
VRFGSLGPRRRWPRPPRWLAVAASVLVAAGVIAAGVTVVIRHGTKPPAASATATATMPATAPAPGVVAVTRLGHRLLGVRAGWELFALGPGEVIRIQFARGRVTRTTVPPLQSSGPVSLLAGPHEAIVRPLDFVPGYLVPDGRAARGLRGALSHGGMVFPGPRPGQVWTLVSGRAVPLAGFDGGKLGTTIRLPKDGQWVAASDGRGYLLIYRSSGGVYDARPGAVRRITAGTVAAVGPTRWLAVRCRHPHRGCSDVVIDPATGTRRLGHRRIGLPLPGVISPNGLSDLPGVISPDGSTAALLRAGAGGTITVHLLSLDSGTDRAVPVHADRESFAPGNMAWSPDSQWLFVIAAHGNLVAVNASTGAVRGLGTALPPVSQLAVRAG